MLPEHEASLTSGGNCSLHHHDEDQRVTHDKLRLLWSLEVVKEVAGNYEVGSKDDIVLVTAPSILTLPIARNGRRLTIIKVGGVGSVVVTGGNINGSSPYNIASAFVPLRIKAVDQLGWIEV